MQRCPNCGQPTLRTADWVCQWCGYPLLSRSYKKIPKTYKQLKEERLYQQEPPTHMLAPEPALEAEAEAEPEPEPIPQPEPALEVEAEPEPEPEPIPQAKSVLAAASLPDTIEVAVKELYSAYKADKVVTDTKLTGKTLRVTGVVDKIVVKDIHDIRYIILTSAERKEEWNVRCTFDREQSRELNRLTKDQTVTVQGKYNGYQKNILMRDCVLVR